MDFWISPDLTAALLQKCQFITLSASVILPRIVKLASDCSGNAKKSPKIPYSAMVREMEK